MNSCNYHQFDDGQGLNGNIGSNENTQGNPPGDPPPAALPDGTYSKDGILYNVDEEVVGYITALSSDVKRDNDGTPGITKDQDPSYSPYTSLGPAYNPSVPGIALNRKQLAQIRQTDPSFKLGDSVLLYYNGATTKAVYFDNSTDATHNANNYRDHVEVNEPALKTFRIETNLRTKNPDGTIKRESVNTKGSVMVVAAIPPSQKR